MRAVIREQLRVRLSPPFRANLGRSFAWLQRYESVIPRTLVSSPRQAVHGGFTARRINLLASLMPTCSTYLEVGVFRGTTLEAVDVPFRAGVDPVARFDTKRLPPGVKMFESDSDTFFSNLDSRVKFDLIYLDGLHEWKQTLRDLANALLHSHSYSMILLDDVEPADALSSLPDMGTSLALRQAEGIEEERWQGDVFKVLVFLQRFVPGLSFVTLQDPGCNSQAVIWKTDPETFIDINGGYPTEIDALTYDDVFQDGSIPKEFRPVRENRLAGILSAEQN